MIKHKNITLAIVLVVTTAMAFVGCKKAEKPVNETPNPDTLVTDTIPEEPPADNIYQFKVLNGEGDSVSLAEYRDKVLLVVNTATQCGYTPQYTDRRTGSRLIRRHTRFLHQPLRHHFPAVCQD